MIQVHHVGDVAIVSFSEGAPSTESFHELVAGGTRKVLLDLSGVTFLSSARLGDIILIDQILRPVSGRLVLCLPDPAVREVLAITKLNALWPAVGSVVDGLRALADGPDGDAA